MNRDKGNAIFVILLGIFVIFQTSKLPNPIGVGSDAVGPRIFPYITAGLLIVMGLWLFLQKSEKSKPFLTKRAWMRLLFILGVYLGYCLLLWAFGFLIATPILLFTLSTMFSVGKQIKWYWRVIYAIVLTAAIYAVFFSVLHMSLPTGKIIKIQF